MVLISTFLKGISLRISLNTQNGGTWRISYESPRRDESDDFITFRVALPVFSIFRISLNIQNSANEQPTADKRLQRWALRVKSALSDERLQGRGRDAPGDAPGGAPGNHRVITGWSPGDAPVDASHDAWPGASSGASPGALAGALSGASPGA